MKQISSSCTFICFFILIATLTACDGDNIPNPNNGQSILLNDTSSTTGSLLVEVIDANRNSIDDAEVQLFTDFEAIDRGIFLFRLFTNGRGRVDFGFLNIGNYYIVAESPDQLLSDTAVVQIRSQKDVFKVVELR